MADITYEGLIALFAERDKQTRELFEKRDQESKKSIQDLEELFEKRDMESKSSIHRLEELFEKRDLESKTSIDRLEEIFQRRDIETRRYLKNLSKEVNKKISDLGDTLGKFAEEQVKADLVNKFDKWGIPVHGLTTHFVQRDQNNEFAYEVDILIYNSEYVIAIEVKNQLKKDDIDEHIDRMQKLQQYPLPDTKGKILLAGVACMIIGEGLDKYAESKGLFVIKPNGENIKIVNKKSFKPREWKVEK
jgi:ferritin-like metal-binding protein YciE